MPRVCVCVLLVALLNKIRLRDEKVLYEGWNFNSGNYLFTIDTK